MLEPLRSILSSHRIILASGSPRRKEILQTALPFMNIEIIPSQAEENLDKSCERYRETPWLYAEDTAQLKAEAVMREISEKENVILIGADTVVTLDKQIYGKPKDNQHAKEMLQKFSEKTQNVYSGVCILKGPSEKVLFHEDTEVTFDTLSDEVIDAYIATKEPNDKAGGYGIQAIGGTLVKGIKGDYFNVVGFPLHHFCKEMEKLVKE